MSFEFTTRESETVVTLEPTSDGLWHFSPPMETRFEDITISVANRRTSQDAARTVRDFINELRSADATVVKFD